MQLKTQATEVATPDDLIKYLGQLEALSAKSFPVISAEVKALFLIINGGEVSATTSLQPTMRLLILLSPVVPLQQETDSNYRGLDAFSAEIEQLMLFLPKVLRENPQYTAIVSRLGA